MSAPSLQLRFYKGNVKLIPYKTYLTTLSKDWAVPLWPEIEAYLQKQTNSIEMRRQELLTTIQSLEFELSQRRAELAALEMDEFMQIED